MPWLLILPLLAALNAPASAAPFTARFDGLRVGLQARVDTTSGKQKRAVTAALKALDKASPTLATDLQLLARLVTKLDKAFHDDFVGQTGLASFLRDALTELRADVGADLAAAVARAAALTDGACATRARRTADRAQGLFDGAVLGSAPWASRAKQLAAVATLVTKAGAQAGKCGGGGGGACDGTQTLTVMVDGTEIGFETFGYFRSDDVQSFVVGGTTNSPFSSLSLIAHGVSGTGTFTVDVQSSWVDHGNTDFSPPSAVYTATGTITLTRFHFVSETNGCGAGTFDVTFDNPGAGRTAHVTGSFDLSRIGF